MREPLELISAYFDDALTDEEFAELRAWLHEDANRVRIFVLESVLHSRLHDILIQEDVCSLAFGGDEDFGAVNPRLLSLLEEEAAAERRARQAARALPDAKASRPAELLDRSLLRSNPPPTLRWVAYGTAGVAAALLFLLSLVFSPPTPPVHRAEAPTTVAGEKTSIARVTRSVAAEFADPSLAATPGTALYSGRYALNSGVVELQFDAGARLIVESPAELELDQSNSAVVRRGRAVAHVPQRAIGFTLRSKGASFVDLGTEFALEVNDSGEANVHVFDGEIALAPNRRRSDALPSRTLQAGAASFVSADGSIVRDIAFDQQKFIRRVPKSAYELAVLQSRPLAYWKLGEPGGEAVVQSTGRLPAPGVLSPGVALGFPGVHGSESRAAQFIAQHEGVDLGLCRNLARATDFTCEAWALMKRTRTGPQRIFSTFDRPPRSGYGFGVVDGSWYQLDADKCFLHFTAHGVYDCVSTIEVPAGQWVHLAAVVQADGEPQLYVNGLVSEKLFWMQAVGEAAAAKPEGDRTRRNKAWFNQWKPGLTVAPGPGVARIGRNPPGSDGRCATERFEGLLSDVAVYGRALTAEEIQRHYEASLH